MPLCLALALLAYGAAVGTRHRAAAAADAAALAAAVRADRGPSEACAAARAVAAAQNAAVVDCVVRSGFADIVAEARPPPLLGVFGPSRVAARAGPR
ncbi:pilus assembly protein TadG-related protein [Yinghuangia sp. ASG 101]|nr:pilus assembly protein TadG-related protein [Yinghuangia sp. ASG 101]